MVDHGDLVIEDVGIGLVEIDPLLDDGLIIGVERNAVRAENAGAFETTGLDFEHVVAAIAVLIDPFTE